MATIKNAPAFSPMSIGNCALWLDAADTTSLVLSGSTVSQWRDKSGSGNHMNQYSAATAPSTSNLNGLNTVYFYTSDPTSTQGTPPFTNVKVLQGTNFQTTVNSTLFLVVYPLYVATSTKFIVNLKSRASNQWNNLYDINMGTGDGTNAGGFGSFIRTDSSYLGVNSSYYTINTTNLTSSEIVGTTVAFYKDASLYRSGTVSLAMPASDNYQVFTLGAYLNTDPYDTTSKMGARAHFCEVLVYNGSLTTSQRQQVEGYLAWKWGTVGSLPTGHPFKSFQIAPFVYPILPTRPKKSALPYFDPRIISGCQLWFDAADSASMSFSGSTVTQWRDKSGRGFHLTGIGTSTLQTFNTQRVMLFNNSYFQNASFTNTGPYAIFFVMKFNFIGNTSGDWQTLTDNISPLRPFVGYDANSQARVAMVYGGSATLNPEIWSLQYSASTTTGFFVNGSDTKGVSTGYGGVGHTNGIRVGYAGNNSAYLNGWLGEILFFGGTLSTTERQQIEGYLAWKWGLQRNLPSNHPYAQVPTNSFQLTVPVKPKIARFTPTQISGCQLWLDAADATTISLSGSSVTQWRDKSGNSNHAAQATLANAPTLSGFNISFNGSQWLTTPITSAPTIESFFIVLNTTKNDVIDVFAGTSSGYREVIIYLTNIYIGKWGTAPTGLNGGVIATNTRLQFNYQYSQTNLSFSVNGTQTGSGTPPFTYTGTNTSFIGSSSYSPNNFVGTINEILYYNSYLSTTQRQQVEGYLAWKWGFAASLPSTHPYAKFPPPP